jgi:hypothetical protein
MANAGRKSALLERTNYRSRIHFLAIIEDIVWTGEMGVHQILEPLLERLHIDANIKTIYGEPINLEGKTLIPVAKVMYGLGGGFGKAKTTDREGNKEEKPASESGSGESELFRWGN